MTNNSQIEHDDFQFEFLSQLGERESWRKEIHRPIYHVHKWWAKRLGSVFRGMILGSILRRGDDLVSAFYERHDLSDVTVFDPFMGSGTTIGEAHKLGCAALGRDINPVAVDAVRSAFGPLEPKAVDRAFRELAGGVGEEIRALYRSLDSRKRPCDVLYYFWVMQVPCPHCQSEVDLFPSYVFSKNAYPARKPETQVVCPECGDVFEGIYGQTQATCRNGHSFDPGEGTAKGAKAACRGCSKSFSILDAIGKRRPSFRQYAKMVLTTDGEKEYLPTTGADIAAYAKCSAEIAKNETFLPTLKLEPGFNTKQAMGYGFLTWQDFFNDRQLFALSRLRAAILDIADEATRSLLFTLFSGLLEFNNVFTSFKGEGTGAVRHMFSHHILKPERTPIEANVWGTPKSSGSFSSLYRGRVLRAIEYRQAPTELALSEKDKPRVCSEPFTGQLAQWGRSIPPRGIAVSCGDSAKSGLPDDSVNLVITDPPFFDNVHYSELADFFVAWHPLANSRSTRSIGEVQDPDAERFATKLRDVFTECHRLLKNDGLLVFTYHHSRDEGWQAVGEAILGAGFAVVNSHPVKAEMSVATPKLQAKEPIQLDIILVCRKANSARKAWVKQKALESARLKIARLEEAGFELSRNDRRIVLYGQLMTTLSSPDEAAGFGSIVEEELMTLA